jgi:hypothetical protein
MRKVIGGIMLAVVGLYALYVELVLLNFLYGFTGVVVGVLLCPIVGALVPLWILINGNFMPALVIYGGGFISALIYGKSE